MVTIEVVMVMDGAASRFSEDRMYWHCGSLCSIVSSFYSQLSGCNETCGTCKEATIANVLCECLQILYAFSMAYLLQQLRNNGCVKSRNTSFHVL